MGTNLDPLISPSEAARQLGIGKSTMSRYVISGAVRSHDGKVRLSEVLEDRAKNIDLTRSHRRTGAPDFTKSGGNTAGKSPSSIAMTPFGGTSDVGSGGTRRPGGTVPPNHAVPPTVPTVPPEEDGDECDASDDDVILVDGEAMSYADARAMKETYLAKLKRLEFETKQGTLAPVDEMLAFVANEYTVIRERLLGIPGKLAGDLDRNQVERVTSEIYEALEELSDVERAKARIFPPDAGPGGDARENDEGTATAALPPVRGRRPEGGRRA